MTATRLEAVRRSAIRRPEGADRDTRVSIGGHWPPVTCSEATRTTAPGCETLQAFLDERRPTPAAGVGFKLHFPILSGARFQKSAEAGGQLIEQLSLGFPIFLRGRIPRGRKLV